MILVKRVYERYVVTDGMRILVDRLWPRGIRRNTPNVDVWLKNIGPSDELRKWYAHDPKKWVEFKRRYIEELRENKTVEQLLYLIESTDPVTLVYSSSDTRHNNAIVLQHFIEKRVKREYRLMEVDKITH